ncbi:MAG: hypothetical protein FWD75_06290 [Propionibacteriaceae bacterium]|nr:hypothetical protein [Propionibacteriaceae bacterium]
MSMEPTHARITRFGALGHGSTPPSTAFDDLPARVSERLAHGEYDAAARSATAATCIDRRPRVDGTDPLLPNVGGGFFGILTAVRAVRPSFDPDLLTADGLAKALISQGLPVFVHIDQNFAVGKKSGCAFNDHLPEISAHVHQIVDEAMAVFGIDPDAPGDGSTTLRDMAERLLAMSQADDLREDAFSRLSAAQDMGATTEILQGTDPGVGADFSFHDGHTLSRMDVLADGPWQFFHVDAWSFEPTAVTLARILPRSHAQAELTEESLVWQLQTAMFLSSVAAVSLLCGPESTLVIRP